MLGVMATPSVSPLARALGEAQRLGMLGARPIEEVIAHSHVFVEGLHGVVGHLVDLGSGGGVPGLVIAVERPDLTIDLVERRGHRADFLRRVIARMELDRRVRVREIDARTVAQEEGGSCEAVTARGFGPPEETLKLARRLLSPTGRILISDPPEAERWPSELLDRLGLERRALIQPAGRISMFHVKHPHGADKSPGNT